MLLLKCNAFYSEFIYSECIIQHALKYRVVIIMNNSGSKSIDSLYI